MVRSFLTFAAGLCLPAALLAAPLTVRVVDSWGKPVSDAVAIYDPTAAPACPAPRGGHYVVAQRKLQFQPLLTID